MQKQTKSKPFGAPMAKLVLIGILAVTVILAAILWIGKQKIIEPSQWHRNIKVYSNGNVETVTGVRLPVDEAQAKTIVKNFCESKDSNYRYAYTLIEKIDNEWRIPMTNINGFYYATINTETGETNCLKQNPSVTIATDKTEYEQGELVEITLKNNLSQSIWYAGQSEFKCENAFFIGAKEENYKEFHTLATAYCVLPAQELKPNSEQVFELKLNDEENAFGFSQWLKAKNIPFPSTYKIEFRYGFDKENSAENKVYSDEFEIKEKIIDEITAEKECKERFLLWCDDCQSNDWEGVLNPEINVCLSDSLDIHLPKSATCESSKESCCSILSEGGEMQLYKCLEDIDKIDFKTANWKTYRNEEYGFEVKYPEGFFPWEPKAEIIQCDYANFANNCLAEKTTINGMLFCLRKTDEGALGTTYTTYNYTTVRDKECFIVSFAVPYPNCSNYLPIESQEIQEAYDKCKLNNEVTKPETINQILSTFKFIEKEEE